MAEKTPGRTRNSTSSKKTPAQKVSTVTPISQGGVSHEGSSTKQTQARATGPAIVEQIRIRAYELFELRGRQEGFHDEDWSRAEAEVLAKFQRDKSA
ncbi:MAG TPA: DUF2934 domain-containing protein [Candidatus Angelobacter sp.]|jgi:hypothetical protein